MPRKKVPARARKPWPPEAKGNKRFAGYTFAFFGEFASWPGYHDGTPEQIAARRGGRVVDGLDETVDVVVFGDFPGAGRAAARKKAEALVARGVPLHVIDEASYRDAVRKDLTGKRFAFAGGFDCAPSGVEDGTLARMVEAAGGIVTTDVDESLDFLVVGNRRGPSKIALQNKAEKLFLAGADIHVIDESAFLELVRIEKLSKGQALDFPTFLNQLYGTVDERKLGRALAMLRTDRHQLFSSLEDAHLVGVVKSQSGSGSVYASFLKSTGDYGCAQPDLSECMGLQGTPCKHLLVLVVGLARAGELPEETAIAWMRQAKAKRPKIDEELCAGTFVRYKGAQAGEIDWRPTETIPEDYYAL